MSAERANIVVIVDRTITKNSPGGIIEIDGITFPLRESLRPICDSFESADEGTGSYFGWNRLPPASPDSPVSEKNNDHTLSKMVTLIDWHRRELANIMGSDALETLMNGNNRVFFLIDSRGGGSTYN